MYKDDVEGEEKEEVFKGVYKTQAEALKVVSTLEQMLEEELEYGDCYYAEIRMYNRGYGIESNYNMEKGIFERETLYGKEEDKEENSTLTVYELRSDSLPGVMHYPDEKEGIYKESLAKIKAMLEEDGETYSITKEVY